MPEVSAYVGHLTPPQLKLLIAVDQRMREIHAAEKAPLCLYADITPIIVALSFDLFPRLSTAKRMDLARVVCEFIAQQAQAAQQTAGHA
jgi:hypothetical protein